MDVLHYVLVHHTKSGDYYVPCIYFPTTKELISESGRTLEIRDVDVSDWSLNDNDEKSAILLKHMKKIRRRRVVDIYPFENNHVQVADAVIMKVPDHEANSLLMKMRNRKLLDKELNPELSSFLENF
jgi:hypothetical protein